MVEERVQRRLSAILAADVVGYSRQMEADESGTLERLKTVRRDVFAPSTDKYGGRIFKVTGDGAFVEFGSAIDAVNCAVAIQGALIERNAALPLTERVELRIGISLGDVIVEGRDLYGTGVNIASRLEALAEPSGICISGNVQEHVANSAGLTIADLGEQKVKNISQPVRAYRVTVGRGEAGHPSLNAGGSLALPDKPSIAVLPFDNLSGDAEQEYFADGVVEALTAALSRIRAFFVIARNSAFAYKGKSTNVRDIGRELGVAYVLEGSVQRAGDRVRITVQLIETDGGAHVWAERYDGSLEDIFDLQDEITEQVAGALQPSIRLAEIERAQRKRPQDLGAYDYAMRAMPHVWRLEKEATGKALEYLEKALEIDPEYPLALALAAWCHAQRSVYNWVDDIESAKSNALLYAERAADLSAEDSMILAVLGTVQTFARNYGTARILLERAVTLDPNSAWAWSRLGWLATYADRPEEAYEHFEKAIRLSPIDPMNFNNYVGIGSAHQVAGDDNEAADIFLRALDERPNALWIHRNLAPALLGAGRTEEAKKSLEALREAYPDFSAQKFKNAMVFSPRVLERIGAQLIELGVPEK